MYVKKKTKRFSHTCALKNYIEEMTKENRTDSSLFVPMRSKKKQKTKKEKKVKNKRNDHALPIKK